jgi:hypothetical protein
MKGLKDDATYSGLAIHGRIILKCILDKTGAETLTGLNWIRPVVNTVMTFGVREIS